MTGVQEYENKYENKIEQLIQSNKDKSYLKGFYYYIQSTKSRGLSSQYNYLLHVVRFMNYTKKKPEELNLDDYTIYLGENKKKSSSYQIVIYTSLKKFSLYLLATNVNIQNPMQYSQRPKYVESEKTKKKRDNGYLTISEVQKFKNAIEDGVGSMEARHKQENWIERDRAIIEIFLTTGIRLSALYKLDISNVDIDNRYIYVKEKGDKYRKIKLSYSCVEVLNDWTRKRGFILDGIDETALFISNRKKRICSQAISNIIRKYGNVIEGKNITPHKLRHTYGTQIYAKTKDINLTKIALGHSNTHTTELYINGTESETDTIADLMETLY